MADPKVVVRHDEENELYHLGAEINGVFVSFQTLPQSDVDATVEAGAGDEEPAAA